MAHINDLIRRAKAKDPALGEELEREVKALTQRRAFGLNFERHTPESVELPSRTVRRGDKVRILPPRGSLEKGDQRLWRVKRIDKSGSGQAELVELGVDQPERASADVADLVVVAEFRDPIYPGLKETGRVERGGDKPYHSVINAENFHALETLMFTHRHSIDAIYIDPPYNTGAKDWKYNNDYVDGEDIYRHSKWLAFMERRLKLARELLNPEDSVLIVTIDEKECARLALLLEQVFPAARIQMISTLINPAAVARAGYFGRSDEYYFFVMQGNAGARPLPLSTEWVTAAGRTHKGEIRWDLLRKSGSSPTRSGHPETFYPFFVNSDGKSIHSVGEPIGVGADRHATVPPEGTFAVWPIRRDGTEGRWRLKPSTVRKVLSEGCIRIGSVKGEVTPIYYLAEGERAKITEGVYTVTGHRSDGSVVTSTLARSKRSTVPGTQWRIGSHDATQYGTRLLLNVIPNRRFPFPKSLYAVEDALRFFVKEKPAATILDFFSGSGTTAHAIMRINKQDGGRRRSISVTNNEVSAEEHKSLRMDGLRPGDPQWDALGICDFVTKPRIRAAITGKTPEGEPIKGDYKFSDEFPMADGFEENAVFFDLTYETPLRVSQGHAFEAIAPLLWLRAGSRGPRIDSVANGWDVTEAYGVLTDLDYTSDFASALNEQPEATTAFVVTDDERLFQATCAELPDHVEPVHLYESYLRNFEINTGRELE